MEVNIHHAKTNLSKLIAAVESGEEVVITRKGKPAVKLVLAETPKKSRRNILGSGIGKIWISPDFDSPQTKAEIIDLFENTKDFD